MKRRLRPTPVERLAGLFLATPELPFGLSRELFFAPRADDPFRGAGARAGADAGAGAGATAGRAVPLAGLETPLGVAAGPHTQMTQGIVAAWLLGARTLELKTVQSLDALEIARPCISAADEGYNCEWSQELRLDESLAEYVNAWVLVHALRRRLGHVGPDPGCAFVMSIGYDMKGILSPGMQRFLDGMNDASEPIAAAVRAIAPLFPEAQDPVPPPRVAEGVTLSTMHGCPPDEIERIGRYLIEERGLATSIKLNPTLLGAVELGRILNGVLGYRVRVPDEAFAHDLGYDAAARMIESLRAAAARRAVPFSLKLTNTLETENDRGLLPASEARVYMSGRALHPLAVRLALRLQRDFAGALDLSFAAGADAFNAADLLACGFGPVTACTDLLKPGGITRLSQYVEELRLRFAAAGARTLDDWVMRYPGPGTPSRRPAAAGEREAAVRRAALANLEAYAAFVLENPALRKGARLFGETIKTKRKLTAFDCVRAPCEESCPAGQAVPRYLRAVAAGDDAAALAVIRSSNPMPRVTGRVCDHLCQFRCVRLAYDRPLMIRDIKRFAAEHGGAGAPLRRPASAAGPGPGGPRVAIVGGGPSGLACAWSLARAGARAEVFEAGGSAGGLVRGVIPAFRVTDRDIDADVAAIESLGVEIHTGTRVDRTLFARLRRDFDAVYVAVGAPLDQRLGIQGEDLPGVRHALAFLAAARSGGVGRLGPRVAVVGGGNSAMDAARVAWRLAGAGGEVTVLYRRTIREMPADHEELDAVREEGIEIRELVEPVSMRSDEGMIEITCRRTALGAPDASGRGRPEPVPGSEHALRFHDVIVAVGQAKAIDFVDASELDAPDARLLAGGDTARGPASVVLAIADGKAAADRILHGATPGPPAAAQRRRPPIAEQQRRAARRTTEPAPARVPVAGRRGFADVIPVLDERQARAEAERCLSCDEVCNLCVSVCPNRAAVFYETSPARLRVQRARRRPDGSLEIVDESAIEASQPVQTAIIVDWCNECGNCDVFCPTAGSPHRDKARLCLSDESLAVEDDAYRLFATEAGVGVRSRHNGKSRRLVPLDHGWLYEEDGVEALLAAGDLAVTSARLDSGRAFFDTRLAAGMALLATTLGPTPLGRWLAGGRP
jgi:putative selenate reductase